MMRHNQFGIYLRFGNFGAYLMILVSYSDMECLMTWSVKFEMANGIQVEMSGG